MKNSFRILLFLIATLTYSGVFAQELKSYQVYDKDREPIDFTEWISELSKYDVVLFGEHHNNSIIHWLQLKTTEALYEKVGDKLILGAEMFERDNQKILDRYLKNEIDSKELAKEARLWPNFTTDYKPLLDFSKANGLPFVAANIPRRYASLVAKNGLDTLRKFPRKEARYMAKMPIKVDTLTPGYSEMLKMMGEHVPGNPMDFVAAQAVKDATMAESIRKASNRRHLFLHFNGDYHSKEYGGIYWYLANRKKRWKIAVISIAEASDKELSLPEDFVPTEFNLVVPEDMTKTY